MTYTFTNRHTLGRQENLEVLLIFFMPNDMGTKLGQKGLLSP